jgi:hypothetical protein
MLLKPSPPRTHLVDFQVFRGSRQSGINGHFILQVYIKQQRTAIFFQLKHDLQSFLYFYTLLW